ncbi:1-phosphofructokinase [Actinotalea sp. K2]|uniref:1-phosphofructokinase n=1 Tax=Actinotalea sp. K2 TaxID=2939438 RepID=UPI0020174F57|nr:1-phosphofructokinase [Actinotalea sp. K2]MCL3859965.1 1-phosphofructokinase [Actinotalea sp. K2]
MILTVTLNPSLDRTVVVDRLVRGQVLRAQSTRLDPGGKGVNVTRALLANGVPSRAVLPVAGAEGDQLVGLLDAERVATDIVPVSGRTRSNITVAEVDGTVTKLNEPGPSLTVEELDLVLDRALAGASPGGWVVLCGSLPPGAPADHYARMTERLTAAGLRVAVDTSGPALAQVLAAGPHLIKPNAEELSEAVGRPLGSRAEVVDAAQELRGTGVGRVLVSLGPAGALLVDGSGVTVGESFAPSPRSSVGAGDAFLAGFLAALHVHGDTSNGSTRSALTQALAWGAAAVQLPGSRMPGPGDIDPAAARLLPDELLRGRLAEPLVGTG